MRLLSSRIKHFRYHLARVEALPQNALLGVLTGIITAVVIALFQEFIALLTAYFTGTESGFGFAMLPWFIRLLLPFVGAVMVIALGMINHRKYQRIGVTHVIERLDWHQGKLYFGNFVHQFIAGALVIATGHSVGREGPAVHLGAAAASLMGKRLRLPNNSLRILVACGGAAAISATFNTPVAGVIFAMEVLLVEYTVGGFLPVILASSCAAIFSQSLYGSTPVFAIPALNIEPFHELPLVIVTALSAGLLGTLYCRLIIFTTHKSQLWPAWHKLLAAAAITGVLGIFAPDIMGTGYSTVNQLIGSVQPLSFLLVLLACKMVATTLSIGLSVPGGLIGPVLFLGAVIGALVARLAQFLPGDESYNTALLVIIGMGAMLGTVLQAPLTALMTILEMTRASELPFPALVGIVIATLMGSLLMNRKGIFEQTLDVWGFDRLRNPLHQALSREGVTSLMNHDLQVVQRIYTPETLATTLAHSRQWLLVQDGDHLRVLMESHGVMALLAQRSTDFGIGLENGTEATIDLMTVPAQRYETHHIQPQASALEAINLMDRLNIDTLYVQELRRGKPVAPPLGVITRNTLQHRLQL